MQPPRLQWFEESAAVEARMQGLGRIIKDAGYPTFITLQARARKPGHARVLCPLRAGRGLLRRSQRCSRPCLCAAGS